MYSFSTDKPEIEKYDNDRFRIPFCIETVTTGEGEDETQQFQARTLFASKAPSLDEKRELIATELNQDVSLYICGHYDMGTQNSIQAIYTNPETSETAKTLIDSMFAWIRDECLTYYYDIKAELFASDEPEMVTWDFSQFDATKPDVSLSSLVVGA